MAAPISNNSKEVFIDEASETDCNSQGILKSIQPHHESSQSQSEI